MPTLFGEHTGQPGHQTWKPSLAHGMSSQTGGSGRRGQRFDPLKVLQTTKFTGMVVESLEQLDEVLVQRPERFGGGIDQARIDAVTGGQEVVLRKHFVGGDDGL